VEFSMGRRNNSDSLNVLLKVTEEMFVDTFVMFTEGRKIRKHLACLAPQGGCER
jgi:hypothetical protein